MNMIKSDHWDSDFFSIVWRKNFQTRRSETSKSMMRYNHWYKILSSWWGSRGSMTIIFLSKAFKWNCFLTIRFWLELDLCYWMDRYSLTSTVFVSKKDANIFDALCEITRFDFSVISYVIQVSVSDLPFFFNSEFLIILDQIMQLYDFSDRALLQCPAHLPIEILYFSKSINHC